jgi:hypothetical protein
LSCHSGLYGALITTNIDIPNHFRCLARAFSFVIGGS